MLLMSTTTVGVFLDAANVFVQQGAVDVTDTVYVVLGTARVNRKRSCTTNVKGRLNVSLEAANANHICISVCCRSQGQGSCIS